MKEKKEEQKKMWIETGIWLEKFSNLIAIAHHNFQIVLILLNVSLCKKMAVHMHALT